MISGIGIESPKIEPWKKAIQGRDEKDTEGHEGIPFASIILCLTVNSTFMPLYTATLSNQYYKNPSNEDSSPWEFSEI